MPAPTILSETVRRALSEDIDRGDVTTAACVPLTVMGEAILRAREPVVVCGLPVVEEVYAQVDPLVDVSLHGPKMHPDTDVLRAFAVFGDDHVCSARIDDLEGSAVPERCHGVALARPEPPVERFGASDEEAEANKPVSVVLDEKNRIRKVHPMSD